MGAYMVLYPRVRVITLFVVRGVYITRDPDAGLGDARLWWFGIQFVGCLAHRGPVRGGGVAFWAHVSVDSWLEWS